MKSLKDNSFLTSVFALALISVAPVMYAQGVSFGPATNFTVGDRPQEMAIGDLNGDGKLDLAITVLRCH